MSDSGAGAGAAFVQFPAAGSGGRLPSVNSIATSTEATDAWPAHMLVASYDDATVRLWDSRSPAVKPAAYITAKRMPGEDTLEVANVAGRPATIALCDSTVVEIDWRNPNAGPCAKWSHTEDLGALDRDAIRAGADTFAVCDDNGVTTVLKACGLQPVAQFGEHDSISCGVASLRGSGAVLSIGMEGSAKIWSGLDGRLMERSDLCDSCWREKSPQMANPPIPACFDLRADHAVVGRGDGSYAVVRVPALSKLQTAVGSASVQLGMLDTITFAPAHATNGLVSVAWASATNNDILLTAAVSGQVMLWDVSSTLAATVRAEADGDEDDGEDGDEPACVFAFDMREDVPLKGAAAKGVDPAQITVGCATVVGESVAVGDNIGRVFLVPIQ